MNPRRCSCTSLSFSNLFFFFFPSSVTRLKPFQTPTGGAVNSLCWTASWQKERDESGSLLKTFACDWRSGHLRLCPAQTGRREPGSCHHTGHPGQRCGWANTASVRGWGGRRGSRGLSACLGECFTSRKPSGGETVDTVSVPGCVETNRSSRKHSLSPLSHQRTFIIIMEEKKLLCCRLFSPLLPGND